MSISGLSNHLCVVAATIIGLIVASSTFQRTRASAQTHDFTNSRQYRRNLAVSKFRENPYWLSNYTWKPPEKLNGPRKRPSWEVDEVTETKAEREERKELEEWDNKMLEVTRREREKWQMDEIDGRSKSRSSDKILMPLDGKVERSPHLKHSGNLRTEVPTEWKNALDNGRWGMTAAKPATQESFKNTPKSSQKSTLMNRMDEYPRLPTTLHNGRWGMSIKDAPKDFLEKITEESSPNSESSGISVKQDSSPAATEEERTSGTKDATRLPKSFSNGRWGMNVAAPTEREFFAKPSKSWRAKSKDQPTVSRTNVSGESMLTGQSDGETSVSLAFPKNRWGMNVKEVPKEFLKELSRSSEHSKGSKKPQKRNEYEVPVENAMMESATEFPNSFSNDRWGMKVDKQLKQAVFKETSTLLREQSTDHSPILEKSINSSQLTEETVFPTSSNDRWNTSVIKVPKEFPKETPRRFLPLGDFDRVWKDRTPLDDIKIHAGQKNGGKTKTPPMDTAPTKLSNGFTSGRWSMDVPTPPRDFLREISRDGLTRIPTVHGYRTVHQRVDANNPLSSKLTLSTIPRISNYKISSQPFISVIEVPIILRILVNPRMQRTFSTNNAPIISYIV